MAARGRTWIAKLTRAKSDNVFSVARVKYARRRIGEGSNLV